MRTFTRISVFCAGLVVYVSVALAGVRAGVEQTILATGVTTNTTTTAVAVPTGYKSVYGQVVCSSGACTQTQTIYGDINDDATNGVPLCTLTLSGTPRDEDVCTVITANLPFYYVVTTSTTGTAATGSVYANY